MGADEQPDQVPELGTWVRLAMRRTRDGEPVQRGKWHLVRGWDPEEERLMLGCTRRDHDITWALLELGRYTVLRSAVPPTPDDEVCRRCRGVRV